MGHHYHLHLYDAFKESEHPRAGEGKSEGGQFVKKGTGGGGGSQQKPTTAQASALRWYSTEGYLDINKCLRKLILCDNDSKGNIDLLSRYLKKSEVSYDLTVYRIIRGEEEIKILKSMVEKGDVFTDPAFVSTSVNPDYFYKAGALQLVINIKKGIKGVANIVDYSEFPEEGEVLINKQSKFKIVNVDWESNKIHMEML